MEDPRLGIPAKSIQRHETFLCGKIMFGNKRFSFEVLEHDYSPENMAKILRKNKMCDREEFVPTFWNLTMAKLKSPVYSYQVKFEDVQSMECRRLQEEWEMVLHLKKPLSCYSKTDGNSWHTVESPVGNAKTIRCVTAPPMSDQNQVAWQCGSQVAFEQAREFAMRTSSVLAALFNGMPVEKVSQAPVKRKANKDTPGNISKRLKKEAEGSRKLSEAENQLLDVESVKTSLKEYVDNLAHTVDMDWHDSYEETDEMILEWFSECGEHVMKAVKVATDLGAGFGNAHEILKCVHDSWLNINAIPFRGCPRDTLSNAEEVELVEGEGLTSLEDMLQIAWPLLLARAASDGKVSDETLNQMLKDAHDNGVKNPQEPHLSETDLLAHGKKSVLKLITQGRERVCKLLSNSAWKSCPCTVKKHRMRRCIDRRFDGPKHLRTRDYSSDSEGGCGFGFGGLFGFI